MISRISIDENNSQLKAPLFVFSFIQPSNLGDFLASPLQSDRKVAVNTVGSKCQMFGPDSQVAEDISNKQRRPYICYKEAFLLMGIHRRRSIKLSICSHSSSAVMVLFPLNVHVRSVVFTDYVAGTQDHQTGQHSKNGQHYAG